MYALHDYDYDLPGERIAQQPAPERDRSRLLFLDRKTGHRSHHTFKDLPSLLLPSDVLVINNTEVIPGRLLGSKASGGKVEVLILDYGTLQKSESTGDGMVCGCLIKASKRPRPGTRLLFDREQFSVCGIGVGGIEVEMAIARQARSFNRSERTLHSLRRTGEVSFPGD